MIDDFILFDMSPQIGSKIVLSRFIFADKLDLCCNTIESVSVLPGKEKIVHQIVMLVLPTNAMTNDSQSLLFPILLLIRHM